MVLRVRVIFLVDVSRAAESCVHHIQGTRGICPTTVLRLPVRTKFHDGGSQSLRRSTSFAIGVHRAKDCRQISSWECPKPEILVESMVPARAAAEAAEREGYVMGRRRA